MPDIFTKEKRSEVMSRIRGTNTGPERIVFRHLRRNKVYFQKHYRRAPGCPDIALPRKRRAVFIDGDFWHGRDFTERRLRLASSKQYFWIQKIQRNMRRDRELTVLLEAKGWKVLRVWEKELVRKRDQEGVLDMIVSFLTHEEP